jgi:hypothetical protein
MRIWICVAVCAFARLSASDYCFIDRAYNWHVDGEYRIVGEQEFKNHGKTAHSHVHYADAAASLYFTHTLTENNDLSWQLGYQYMKFDWDKNPRFRDDDFNYGIFSVALISTSAEQWRWVVNPGVAFDLETFNFGQSAVGYLLLWGRYQQSDILGLHIGFFGFYGAKNGYMMPVLGFDWEMSDRWSLHAIFPLDFSLNYAFNDTFSAALAYTGFGRPYRFPWRAHGGKGRFHDPIVEVFASGLELDLNMEMGCFTAGIGAGWNFGGWILIKDHDNHHGNYYDFKGAPYAQVNAGFTF